MNEFEPGIFNSGVVLNYLLKKGNSFTLYLEDGAKLSGTLLGWDADFLLIREGKSLQMVRTKKILRLQADLEQIIAVDSAAAQDSLFRPSADPSQIGAVTGSSTPKFKPSLTEVKTAPPVGSENNQGQEKSDFKDRLDHLVKNW